MIARHRASRDAESAAADDERLKLLPYRLGIRPPPDKLIERFCKGPAAWQLLKRGQLTPELAQAQAALLSPTLSFADLAKCDMVVEAVFESLELKLQFSPMSFRRWQLMQRLEGSLRGQTELGFAESDVDDVRRLVADTELWLLGVTVLASVLHLLFEFLAFKSDIEFWKNNRSLRGLSARSVLVESPRARAPRASGMMTR